MRKIAVSFVLIAMLMAGCSLSSANQSAQESKTSSAVEKNHDFDTMGAEEKADKEVDSSVEDWSEKYDGIIAKVYGDDFHMAYSMSDIVGKTDDESFLCDYSKLDLTVENNCVLLAQEAGDHTDRTVIYEVDVISGECAVKYDNDQGESVVIWSGKGQAEGTAAVKLSGGANCLRIEALDNDTRLKIKLQCTK
ncbi:hypothetical protein C0033_22285 [Clostridium sp. chh4-2]|uniref:hypothetical protein n=1 Tax=Clostridium sp. chh4-2 TaxID=2067550 RepID=UPI000CCE8478|nr:hypothetical protein [Clostridium sp. chh4-2]PNV59826.1 hypothetical protein C0033_22285 [Clostridium sp. chh4-2]